MFNIHAKGIAYGLLNIKSKKLKKSQKQNPVTYAGHPGKLTQIRGLKSALIAAMNAHFKENMKTIYNLKINGVVYRIYETLIEASAKANDILAQRDAVVEIEKVTTETIKRYGSALRSLNAI